MTLKEIFQAMTDLAPKGITAGHEDFYSVDWEYEDSDGDTLSITLNKKGLITVMSLNQAESWYATPDFFMWLGMLGSLAQQELSQKD